MAEALASKTCTPCRGGIPPLTREQAELFHAQTPDWQLSEEAHNIERSFRFRNFRSEITCMLLAKNASWSCPRTLTFPGARMNPFFGKPSDSEFIAPNRVYARTIDADELRYVLFDAVDASWFDTQQREFGENLTRELIDRGPIYAIEVNSRNETDAVALSCLETRSRFPRWVEIEITPDRSDGSR
jgi:hypothetical protein